MGNTIAFYPAFIAFIFLGLAYMMINIDFSDTGKQIKAQLTWLRLKDANTARTIVSVIAAGILSLTVFSFTMVMVILNQAASQMSNRVLDKLIGNRYQQVVLGFYIGTIVYSLFLLTAIRDIDSGIYVPALSTYFLIGLAISDIFLFIYFLHYITQSVKYSVIIRRIHKQTLTAMEKTCRLSTESQIHPAPDGQPHLASKSGIFEKFGKEPLLRVARENDLVISILVLPATFVLKGSPVLAIQCNRKNLSDEIKHAIDLAIYINPEASIENDFYYGFRQLAEVAIKALSPGINDPGTAVESLRSLISLLSYRLDHFADNIICDEDGMARIYTREHTFEEIFNSTVQPIWDYGKNDRFVQHELEHLLTLLLHKEANAVVSKSLAAVRKQIQERDTEQTS